MSLFGGEAKTKELNRITRNKYLKRLWRVSAENLANNGEKEWKNIQIIHFGTLRFFSAVRDSSAFFHK
jgi:hypothetical protein